MAREPVKLIARLDEGTEETVPLTREELAQRKTDAEAVAQAGKRTDPLVAAVTAAVSAALPDVDAKRRKLIEKAARDAVTGSGA